MAGAVVSAIATHLVVPPIAWPACEKARFWVEIINSERDTNGKLRLRQGVENIDDWICERVAEETTTEFFFPEGTIFWGLIIAFAQVRHMKRQASHQHKQ